MNYGGAGAGGQYGQMGMGGPLGPNGQPMHPQQMMQPGSQAAMQRMMMQQQQNAAGMRAGMYHPQMTRQQHAAMMQQQGMGYNPMMTQQVQMMINKFPNNWKANLDKEQNPERKQMLFRQYATEYQNMSRQNMGPQNLGMGSGMMPPNGMSMYPPQGGPVPPGMGHMPNKAMMSQMQAMQRMQQQQQAAAAGGLHGPGGMPHPSAVGPQVSALQSQAMPTGSPSTLSVPGQQLGAHGSPSVAPQPTTPQNPSSVQPASVEIKQPASVSDQPEYATMVSDLRLKYLDQLNRIGERCNLDNMPLPKGYKVLMEILGAKRTVAVPVLLKASRSVKTLCERSYLSFPIMDEIRKVQEDDDGKPVITSPTKTTSADPWDAIRHRFIRVPDDVLKIVETPVASPKPAAKRNLTDDASGIPLKTPKLEEDVAKVKAEPVEEEDVKPVVSGKLVELECMFGKGKKWQMSEIASQELADIPWRLDPDTVPPSYRCPDVTICFDAKILLAPPLRVMLPATYPTVPPVVLFDRSFPKTMKLSSQLATLFERRLSLTSTRSLTCIYESFKHACEELVRLQVRGKDTKETRRKDRKKNVKPKHHLVPTKHRQKQLVA